MIALAVVAVVQLALHHAAVEPQAERLGQLGDRRGQAASSQRVATPGRTPRAASARAANSGEPPVL